MAKQYALLQFFEYKHLPVHLQTVSQPISDLAELLVNTLPNNVQRDKALEKLLEAKDCAVRAIILKDM